MKLEFSRQILEKKKVQISNFMKISLVVTVVPWERKDERTDVLNEANSRLPQFCARVFK